MLDGRVDRLLRVPLRKRPEQTDIPDETGGFEGARHIVCSSFQFGFLMEHTGPWFVQPIAMSPRVNEGDPGGSPGFADLECSWRMVVSRSS